MENKDKNQMCGLDPVGYEYEKNIYRQIKSIEYTINFHHDFEDTTTIVPYLEILSKATYNDVIIFNITSYGGDAETAFTLRNAIKNCKAKTIARVFYAASAATILALSCEEIIFMDNCCFMIHGPKCYYEGKLQDLQDKMSFQYKRFCNIMYDVYKAILSKEEIKEAIQGKEFWFDERECIERIQKFYKHNNPKKKEKDNA